MKSVLLSTRPKWCEKICHEIGTDKKGKPIYEKSIEVRKTKPSIPTPFKVFIYETYDKKYDGIGICWGKGKSFEHGCKKIIGEFVCDRVAELDYVCYWNNGYEIATCMTYREVANYGKGKTLYGWHISQLKIYDKPKELREFYKPCPTTEKGDCLSCDCLADNDYGGICTNNLTRPPQSYMYVEEV
jgi:hypothetical protein